MRFTLVLAFAVASFALAGTTASFGPAHAQASVSLARGTLLFLRRASCHSISSNAPAKIGPHLSGIVGRKGDSLRGYRYSKAINAKARVWNGANLDRWIAAPGKVVPGTSMAFVGLSKPADRQALIAYLKTLR